MVCGGYAFDLAVLWMTVRAPYSFMLSIGNVFYSDIPFLYQIGWKYFPWISDLLGGVFGIGSVAYVTNGIFALASSFAKYFIGVNVGVIHAPASVQISSNSKI